MFDFGTLERATQQVLGTDQPITVGIFGLCEDVVTAAAAFTVADTISDVLGAGVLAEGIIDVAGFRAGREIDARGQGVSVRMVVAVTPLTIHLLSLPAVGTVPGREVMRFGRATTTVQIRRYGLARRIRLTDLANGQKIRVTAGIAPWSRYRAGTRAVIGELGR